jgi:hypothetical protein
MTKQFTPLPNIGATYMRAALIAKFDDMQDSQRDTMVFLAAVINQGMEAYLDETISIDSIAGGSDLILRGNELKGKSFFKAIKNWMTWFIDSGSKAPEHPGHFPEVDLVVVQFEKGIGEGEDSTPVPIDAWYYVDARPVQCDVSDMMPGATRTFFHHASCNKEKRSLEEMASLYFTAIADLPTMVKGD